MKTKILEPEKMTLGQRFVMTFFMMALMKNIPKIKVSRKYRKFIDPVLGDFAHGIKFAGDPDATTPYNTDAAVGVLADAMRTTHSGRQINTSKPATSTEKSERKSLLQALDENAAYLEIIANKVAVSKGDVNAGYTVVTRVGYEVAGKGILSKITGFVDSGVGWAHAREATSKKGVEAHIWEGGSTTGKGIPPTSVKRWVTLQRDCIFNNIPSNTVFAYHHASVVPVGHKTTSSAIIATAKSLVSKIATLLPVSKSKHPIIDINNGSPYNFGEWRYIVGQ